jgi:hypothetical protein
MLQFSAGGKQGWGDKRIEASIAIELVEWR